MTATRKRSGSLRLTSMLVGAASLSVAGCDAPSSSAQWNAPAASQGEQVAALAYANPDACKAANEVSDAECDTAYATAKKDDETNAPRFDGRSTCEDVYGAGNCVPRNSGGGGSFFTPLLAGFVIGQMMDGGRGYSRGTGLYREDGNRGGGGYSTGWGGSLARDYNTGRTTIGRQGVDPPMAVREAPPRMQTRTSVVSRGGFGGGSRGFGYGG